ncbi:MAG: hypothetical protein ACREUT_14015 [Steroidobacteraceae bacterium]
MIHTEIREYRRLSWIPVLVLWAVVLAGLIEPLAALPYRVSTGYNEGWNALWSDVALRGGVLYPSPSAAIANNYPPLSFYVVGALGRMLGDNIIAGRIISLASLLGIAWLLFAWLRLAGTSCQLAAFGAAVFLAALTSYAPGYIAFDDPQLLAHAVMLSGLLLLWRGQFSGRAVVLSAVMMVSGGFIKDLLLPLPLATTIWLAIHRRERLGVWLTAAAITAGTLFAASWIAFGGDFFRDVFAGRAYDLPVALRETASACIHLSPMLVLTAVAAAGVRSLETAAARDATRLVASYAAWAAAVGIAASTGVGVNVNAFFDLLIACSLGSALGLEALASLSGSWPGAASRSRLASAAGCIPRAAPWIAAAVLGSLIAYRLPAQFSAMAQLSRHERETGEDIRLLRTLGRGHAACEEPALCYWAGSRFEVDVFNFGQKLTTGALPASACEKVFGASSIAVLQLKAPAAIGTPRLPDACNQVIRRYFTPVRESSNGEILIRTGVQKP